MYSRRIATITLSNNSMIDRISKSDILSPSLPGTSCKQGDLPSFRQGNNRFRSLCICLFLYYTTVLFLFQAVFTFFCCYLFTFQFGCGILILLVQLFPFYTLIVIL